MPEELLTIAATDSALSTASPTPSEPGPANVGLPPSLVPETRPFKIPGRAALVGAPSGSTLIYGRLACLQVLNEPSTADGPALAAILDRLLPDGEFEDVAAVVRAIVACWPRAQGRVVSAHDNPLTHRIEGYAIGRRLLAMAELGLQATT